MSEKKDARDYLREQWLLDLESGVAPWAKPWKCKGGACGRPRNFESKRPYSGLNTFTLLWEAMNKGYVHNDWLTFAGVQRLGGQVKKGEHGTWVLQPVPASFTKKVKDGDGKEQEEEVKYFRFRGLRVFNVDQTTLELPPPPKEETAEEVQARLDGVDSFIQALGARIGHGGDRAYYSPDSDRIQLPPFESFVDAASYYATSLHEHAHWTGHTSRLDRDLKGWHNTTSYAQEELVAEMAAAFLCLDLGIEGKLQHREYIGCWVKHLQEQKDAIFKAAAAAEKAAAWMMEQVKVAVPKAA